MRMHPRQPVCAAPAAMGAARGSSRSTAIPPPSTGSSRPRIRLEHCCHARAWPSGTGPWPGASLCKLGQRGRRAGGRCNCCRRRCGRVAAELHCLGFTARLTAAAAVQCVATCVSDEKASALERRGLPSTGQCVASASVRIVMKRWSLLLILDLCNMQTYACDIAHLLPQGWSAAGGRCGWTRWRRCARCVSQRHLQPFAGARPGPVGNSECKDAGPI